jgi:hypothetical protein
MRQFGQKTCELRLIKTCTSTQEYKKLSEGKKKKKANTAGSKNNARFMHERL